MFSLRNVQDETYYLPVNLMMLTEFRLRESGSQINNRRLIKRYYMCFELSTLQLPMLVSVSIMS